MWALLGAVCLMKDSFEVRAFRHGKLGGMQRVHQSVGIARLHFLLQGNNSMSPESIKLAIRQQCSGIARLNTGTDLWARTGCTTGGAAKLALTKASDTPAQRCSPG